MDLTGREIVLGVTGGIAAYKSADLVSRLRHKGANVSVIMTKNATEFIAPLTFRTLSARPVAVDTFQSPEYWNVEHVALAQRAEIFLIAPATANILAKMAHGIADDMLSTTVLATKAPILVAPAMNTGMWTAEATRENVGILSRRGVHFVGPDSGLLACGDTGSGRMSEPADIVAEVERILGKKEDMKGLKVLITAGATRERLDPVRFLTNDSSGKMGFALAEAARDRGAEVVVVKGATTAALPRDLRVIEVESTGDLLETMEREAPENDIVIQAAAPADYKPAEQSPKKDQEAKLGRACDPADGNAGCGEGSRGEEKGRTDPGGLCCGNGSASGACRGKAEEKEPGSDCCQRCDAAGSGIRRGYQYRHADHAG